MNQLQVCQTTHALHIAFTAENCSSKQHVHYVVGIPPEKLQQVQLNPPRA